MTTYKLGDILLIGFPQTDLKKVSKRPAVVIFDAGDLDVLVARVTSKGYFCSTDYKVKKWKESGLLTESYVRLSKMATLKKALVIKKMGSLSSENSQAIKGILQRMF